MNRKSKAARKSSRQRPNPALRAEGLKTLPEMSRTKGIRVETLRHWITIGRKSRWSGERSYLEWCHLNGDMATSLKALRRFEAALDGEELDDDLQSPGRP